jgi:hypothetical protein
MKESICQFSQIVDSTYDSTEINYVLEETVFGNYVRHLNRGSLILEEYSWEVFCVITLMVGSVLVVVDLVLILDKERRHYLPLII